MSVGRLKGQEVEVLLVVAGTPKDTITTIRNFEVTAKVEKKEEAYLGQKTNQYDDIFNGVDGRMEVHTDSQDILPIIQSIIERARRREPGTKVNIKATLNYPNGDRPRVLLNDVFFGPFPINIPARGDYVTVGMDFSCSDITFLTT